MAAAGRVDGGRSARAQIPGEGKGLTLYPPEYRIRYWDPEHLQLSSLGAPGIDLRVPMGCSEGREVVTSVTAPGHVSVHTW